MPATINPTCYHVSASSIAAFKACPTRFRLAYREGLRLAEDTESQRVGTNWHAMHETYANAISTMTQERGDVMTAEEIAEAGMNGVLLLLNQKYEKMPASKTAHEWALERQILLTCFVGYQWYYQNDPIEFLASEVPFNLPLHMPRTGLPLPMTEVQRVGKIDHVIRWQGSVGALERKSTSRSIASDSDYWDKAKKDTQVSMYALAFRDMTWQTKDAESWASLLEPGLRYGNTLYDVWHKPTIKPTPLSQKDTAAFIESGEYCGQKFQVEHSATQKLTDPPTVERTVHVNQVPVEIEEGKKGFGIKESIEMYGARLLGDIYERPEFYFVRREIARTDDDLIRFRKQLFAIYTSQKLASKHGAWVENESACRATFPCSYIPICYGPGADAVCDGKTTPPNFKRIFVDLTVNGEVAED